MKSQCCLARPTHQSVTRSQTQVWFIFCSKLCDLSAGNITSLHIRGLSRGFRLVCLMWANLPSLLIVISFCCQIEYAAFVLMLTFHLIKLCLLLPLRLIFFGVAALSPFLWTAFLGRPGLGEGIDYKPWALCSFCALAEGHSGVGWWCEYLQCAIVFCKLFMFF